MGLMANLYQSMEFRINDKTVSRISDYVPQIDALETRLSKSKAWLEGVGNSTNWWEDEFKNRQFEVVSDPQVVQVEEKKSRLELGFAPTQQFVVAVDTGIITQTTELSVSLLDTFQPGDEIEIDVGGAVGTVRYRVSNVIDADNMQLNNLKGIAIADAVYEWRRVRMVADERPREIKTFEMTWQPPLSIFKVGHALPSGRYELVLNPQTSSQFRKRAIESLLADKNPSPDAAVRLNEFKFEVIDMYLYTATVDGPRADDITYLLDLEQTRCQVDVVGTGDFTQKNFDVSPSTYALTTAFQDQRAGNNTLYSASKFKIGAEAEDELKLNRLFINYAGQNRPQPDADPTLVLILILVELKQSRNFTNAVVIIISVGQGMAPTEAPGLMFTLGLLVLSQTAVFYCLTIPSRLHA
jgi:hypothetical protein